MKVDMKELLKRILDNPNCILPDSVRAEIREILDEADAWASTAEQEMRDLGLDRYTKAM